MILKSVFFSVSKDFSSVLLSRFSRERDPVVFRLAFDNLLILSILQDPVINSEMISVINSHFASFVWVLDISA